MEVHKPASSTLIAWVLANLFGAILSVFSFGLINDTLAGLILAGLILVSGSSIFFYALYPIEFAVLGFIMGATQWIVIKRHLPEPGHWIKKTLLGYLLASIIFMVADILTTGLGQGKMHHAIIYLSYLICFTLMGTIIGTAQWTLLRPYYRQAKLWVPVSVVGFLVFFWSLLLPMVVEPEYSIWYWYPLSVLGQLLVAIITGVTLVFLIRRPVDTNVPSPVETSAGGRGDRARLEH
ncbi:MAG: hypothetical protein JXB38_17725 [Anaerolineales bacterium]|nr:hypothetical protein [Anaerolineales bacterium]